MPWNNFALTEDDIVSLYPNTTIDDFGGDVIVNAAIDRAVNDVLDLMPERIYQLFTDRVVQEIMAGPASGAETGYELGLGKLAAVDATSVRAYAVGMDERFIKPLFIPAYLADNYTDNVSLGGTNNKDVTFAPGTIQKNNWYLITYSVDVDELTSFPGAARIAQYRAAYELGSKLFTSETGNWQLVEDYGTIATDLFKKLQEGKIIFDEVRRLRFAIDIEPATTEVTIYGKNRA